MLQEVRFGLRGLRRSPGFTSWPSSRSVWQSAPRRLYAVVDGVVLRLLHPRPEQLVQLRQLNQSGQPGPFSDPNFEDLRGRHQPVQGDG